MNFILAIIDSLVGFVQRNPLTTLLIVILALGAPALLKGIALCILYFLMGLVILVVVLMLAFRWRIYKVRKQMEQLLQYQLAYDNVGHIGRGVLGLKTCLTTLV